MRAAAVVTAVLGLIAACGARTPLELGESMGDDDGGPPPIVDGASPDSDRPPNQPTRAGYLAAIGTPSGAFATARFYAEAVDPACAYLGAVGTCSVVMCFSSDAPTSDDAGLINVRVDSNGLETLIDYQGVSPTGTYSTSTFAAAANVGAGTSLDFTSGGAIDVPMFMVDITLPAFGTLTSPVVQVSTTIDTSVDLPLAWEPIAFGDAVFALSPEASTGAGPTLVCFFDGASGAGVVPHGLLAEIKQASPGGEAAASFLAMARASTVAGDWTVSAVAVTETTQQSGTLTLE